MNDLVNNETKSVFEHIGDLRKKLLIALGAFVFGVIFAHIFHEKIINFLLEPIGNQNLIFLSPLEPLFFIFKIDLIGGLIITFPIIILVFFSYINPTLSRKASKNFIIFYILSIILIATGIFYSLLVTIPISLKFLFSINVPGIENQFSAKSYIDFFIAQILIVSIIFQLPIIIIGGIKIGILKTKTLSKKRNYAYLIITIALAIITPTIDIFSLIIVLLPCILIFEISLIGGKLVEKLKRKNI